MSGSFDQAAATYDHTFTTSAIGKLQRSQVRYHLAKILTRKNIVKILEINCGTGEDAIWLAAQGYDVVACDISEQMIAVAKSKANSGNIIFKKADINQLPQSFPDQRFDMVFSNFGGLNCLKPDDLQLFFRNAENVLAPQGIMVIVIMPKSTIWEQFFFLAKRDFRSIFRRQKDMAMANVEGESIPTYYYNPKEAVTLSSKYFRLMQLNPIGFFVPPSYLESFFKRNPRTLSLLGKLDKFSKNLSMLAKYADHCFIAFEKK